MWIHFGCVSTYSGLGVPNVIMKNQRLKLNINHSTIILNNHQQKKKRLTHLQSHLAYALLSTEKSCGSIGSDALQVFDRGDSFCLVYKYVLVCMYICMRVCQHALLIKGGLKLAKVLLTPAFFGSYNETVGLAGASQFYI